MHDPIIYSIPVVLEDPGAPTKKVDPSGLKATTLPKLEPLVLPISVWLIAQIDEDDEEVKATKVTNGVEYIHDYNLVQLI